MGLLLAATITLLRRLFLLLCGDFGCSSCSFPLGLLSCLLSENVLSLLLSGGLGSGITSPLGKHSSPGGSLPLYLEHSGAFS